MNLIHSRNSQEVGKDINLVIFLSSHYLFSTFDIEIFKLNELNSNRNFEN